MSLTWKDSFSIGIAEIDRQHRELFLRIDDLEEAIKSGKENSGIINIFKFLDEYVQRHFKAEEELQSRYRYPHLAMHAAEHEAFKKRLKGIESTLNAENPSEKLAVQTKMLLTQWLISHVTSLDTELKSYINEARTKEWESWLVSNF